MAGGRSASHRKIKDQDTLVSKGGNVISSSTFKYVVNHVIAHGDTDIFPLPIEARVFKDKPDETISLLKSIDTKFDDYFHKDAPENHRALSGVGYTGFRWAAQLDPLWNLYFLALVWELSEEIEESRVRTEKEVVFSYRRADPKDDPTLFTPSIGWKEFRAKSAKMAAQHKYVLVCDISDFYSRVYHHRLENALLQAAKAKSPKKIALVKRIMLFLQHFSHNNSYGLPVGGNAARFLSELLLTRTDKLFLANGIKFCRFADDYCVFADTEDEAFRCLVAMSELLLRNEGLSLQKSKTRIVSGAEFISENNFEYDDEKDHGAEASRFLRLSLHYDPYSPTADADYELLKEELSGIDVQRLIARELAKSRVHNAMARKLIDVVRHLPEAQKHQSIQSFIENYGVLAPLFPTLMRLLKREFSDLPAGVRISVIESIGKLIANDSHITQIEINLLYAIRVMSEMHTDESEEMLNLAYRKTASALVRREIMLTMAKWGALHWVSDKKSMFSSFTKWERRSFIICAPLLDDEGKHWLAKAKKGFSLFDSLCESWASDKYKSGSLQGLL
ncbi:RNA-directed DNA polymerase [Uliginosibacterium sp. H1]|uniref:RNA-directed DNA polymerase n=1 Tax=Uliginosibacterium sp. H1 TaxID=3114757 RepID=UPI002E180652|nr:RNA-directed DNA polymerase [Uliginosibacterium sp. H1]